MIISSNTLFKILLYATTGSLVLLVTKPVHAQTVEEIFSPKCSECHSMAEFESVLLGYSWSNLPLRTWLSNHHKPRLPSISLSEAEVAQMETYITRLFSRSVGGTKTYEIVETDKLGEAKDSLSLDQKDRPSGVLNQEDSDQQQAPEVKTQVDVNLSDCLNCK